MSTASTDTGHDHGEELPCEPDDVPVRFLTIIGGGLTAVTLILIAIAVWAFNTTAASELAAKGYSVDREVPVDGAGAAPAEGAHE